MGFPDKTGFAEEAVVLSERLINWKYMFPSTSKLGGIVAKREHYSIENSDEGLDK